MAAQEPARTVGHQGAERPGPIESYPEWKLEQAETHLGDVIRRARTSGPQRVTVRGKDAVVVIAVDELRRLMPVGQRRQPLVDFLRSSDLDKVAVERAPDRGRDIEL